MSDVPSRSDLDGMVERYLGELDRALARLPVSGRDQLVGEIREHITALRSERPARDTSDMEALLNRVGLPEDIAAVALEDMEPADNDHADNDHADNDHADNDHADDAVPAAPASAPSPPRAPLLSNPRRVGLVGAAVAVALVLVVGIASLTAHSHNVFDSQARPSPSSSAPPAPHAPTRLTVPDVVGQSEAQASVTLQSADFGITVFLQPSSTSAAGIVVSQSPAAGSLAARQTTVTLDVSSGSSSSPS